MEKRQLPTTFARSQIAQHPQKPNGRLTPFADMAEKI
jgi:hypothetical protein